MRGGLWGGAGMEVEVRLWDRAGVEVGVGLWGGTGAVRWG